MLFANTLSPVRRSSYAPFVPSHRTMERFLDEAVRAARPQDCQVEHDDNSVTLRLDVPGIGKEHLSISIEGAVVRIQSKEGAPRSYRAAYELAHDIDPTLSEAKLEHGVLSLKLAKKVPVDTHIELPIQ
jgi:HSP20 family protein